MSRFRIDRIDLVVFLAGLAAVCWVAAGYAGSNPLALAVTLLIGACYLTGALELRRYRHATSALGRAVAALSAPPPTLEAWLEPLPVGLRGAVRARVEGERVGLPGPALTPYLVGLLVLLGMLGTLLGMVVTLRGTGAALESATDLDAIRASLAAPVRGLGFAFGTSIAGVASSAMLGLLSALYRRERLQAVQRLDAQIATTLRSYSHAHQREATLRMLQRHAEAMPVLAERLQAMMATFEQQGEALGERQLASQQAFFERAEASYGRLADSVGRTLQASAAESARAAGAALRPVVEATLTGLEREAAALHATVAQAVQRQLDGVADGVATTTHAVAQTWRHALTEQREAHEALAQHQRNSVDQFAAIFEQRSAGLLDGLSTRLAATTSGFEATTTAVAETWNRALTEQRQANETLAQHQRNSVDQFAATFEQRSVGLLDGVSTRLAATADRLSTVWDEALARHEQAGSQLATDHRQALTAAAAAFEQHSAALLRAVDQSHAQLQTELAARDEQRLAAWTGKLAAMSADLRAAWEQTGAQTASHQQAICETLEQTAREVMAGTRTHAGETIAEIARLVQAASEAPRVAAEVVAELRQKLSDSMARDTAMLEERSRLLDTLATLLDAVNHASHDQRSAIDALVATSADLLDRVGARFADQLETESRKLDHATARVTAGAVEVASLGDAFGAAVQSFGASNDQLVAQLQRIEAALGKSLARSDEQLAYYVAQAREVVDLSVLSQKQIVEDLQRLAARQAAAGAGTA